MARQVQLRRGTTAEHSTFTGAVGEVTVDTDKDVVVVHNGSTVGGFPLMRVIHTGNVDITGNITGTQFSGNLFDVVLIGDVKEKTTVSATAATGTIAFDVLTQQVLFFTTNASGNFTVNIRGNGSTTLNNLMAVGDSITLAFLVTNGGTAYYNTVVQVDGATVTPKFQGGTAPDAGNASSVDIYTYTVIKTGSATFSVFASQTQFA